MDVMSSEMGSHVNSTFENFCGGKFWDVNLTWNLNSPQFTLCFQITLLVWIPCAFYWVMLFPYSCYLSSLRGPELPRSILHLLKSVFASLMVVTTIFDCVKGGIDLSSGVRPAAYVATPAILTVTLFSAVIIIQVERTKGVITSGVLFLFYTVLLIAGLVPFYMKLIDPAGQGWRHDMFGFGTFYVYYTFLIIQWILYFFAETPPQPRYSQTEAPCPEVGASFISRVTFWWVNSLIIKGYKKGLTEDEMWSLHPRDLTDTTGPKFERAWKQELSKTEAGLKQAYMYTEKPRYRTMRHSPFGRTSFGEYGQDGTTPLLQAHTDEPNMQINIPKKKTGSLLKVLTKVYWFPLLQSFFLKMICDLLNFAGPMLQGLIISYTTDPAIQTWKGYLYASLFLVSSVLYSSFFHQSFHISMNLGMRVKAAIISAVYKKALTMSNESRKTSTVGEIVNLMSVDAQRIQDVTGYLYIVWSAPLQITIALFLLYRILGPSVFAGVAVMVLLIPVNAVIMKYQGKLQVLQMGKKDERIKIMNEILNGIKVLKLYAWELSFRDKIAAIRNIELSTLQKYAFLSAFGNFSMICAPFIVTLASFITFVLLGNQLDANTAFVSLTLFNLLRFPINMLPMILNFIINASVSMKRVSKFLHLPDIDFNSVQHSNLTESTITIEDGTFAWGTGEDDTPALKNIKLDIGDGSLVAVVGQVGSGKSSLISALLGEMEKIQGKVNVRGSLAYVAQQAWIQNKSLRDNILFGQEMDEDKYDEILEACALKADLEILPGGDLTEIGEKGINLSGGQKQRVSLARAVYNDADLYLLDDPLSAVDSHVGKHIFEKVIGEKGLLKNRTRILVTHGVQWVPKVDKIIVLVKGVISEMGSYDELLSHEGAFAQFLKMYLTEEETSDHQDDQEVVMQKKRMLERVNSVISYDGKEFEREEPASERKSLPQSGTSGSSEKSRRKSSVHSKKEQLFRQLSRQKSQIEEVKKTGGEKLIEEEKAEMGKVKWSVFWTYISAQGPHLACLYALCCLIFQVSLVYSSIWLAQWTEDPLLTNSSLVNTTEYTQRTDMYLEVYGALGAIQALFVLAYSFALAVTSIRASRKLHNSMMDGILHSPMNFFDTTPIGRIINRFSRDIETIDSMLPVLIRNWLIMFVTVISTVIVIAYTTPVFLAVAAALSILYFFIQRFYIPTTRQLKRIESTSRSPIYVHFSETVTGASTIRAYGAQHSFIQTSNNMVDHNLAFYFAGNVSNRWLGFRLEFLGAIIVFSAAMFAVIGKDTLKGGLVGLSISYALQITMSLSWLVRMNSDLESNIVSVERVKEYSQVEPESDWQITDTSPPPDWPTTGNVQFESYSTQYRAGLDLVLTEISAHLQGGHKIGIVGRTGSGISSFTVALFRLIEAIGIVGRTGAGKSSLTVALFRLIEAVSGKIIIDDVEIANLGLHQLRSKLTILPQDPVLFSGTLRMNLDPFDIYTDSQLWTALEHAHLKSFVDELAAGLDYECGEGGQNLSVGQKQLVCLARTLLRKTKILILDEATAAVDLETDDLIQSTIREKFADCTVITIAHRLNTIMDYDKVMVLDVGRIAEFDEPHKLLQDQNSIFHGMAKDAGLA